MAAPGNGKIWSKSELAEAYGITLDTLQKWVKPVCDKPENIDFFKGYHDARLITPKQYELITAHLGEPN
jgi:hypothetical protein